LLAVAIAAAAGIAAFSPADAQGTRQMAVSIGGQEVILVVDPDQCLLERDHPSDKRVYELVERGLAGQNELLLAAADCDQIEPWRNGARPTLDDFTQVQVGLVHRTRNLAGREEATSREICAALRKHGDALITGPVEAVRERFNRASDVVKLNETQLVGVVHEDADACYASLLQRIRTEQGTDKLILCVYAHVVVRGRLLYMYRYTEGDNYASMVRMTDLLRKSVQAHLDANR
jgi:hypothetical protein